MGELQKTCPATGEIFQPRRSNQKFSSAKARNAYYNELAKKIRDKKAQVDKALERNRKIILSTLGSELEVVKTRDFLLGAGLNFNLMTNTKKMDDKVIVAIYDVAYSKLSEGSYKLMRL
jgi:hypothetical protein